ncbi:MAG: class I fructose-bisphosphate aldolase, partial [Candidatus Ranarchaeia archaeon]
FTLLTPNKNQRNLPTSSTLRAIQLGADAIIANGFIGSDFEGENIQFLSELAEEADAYSMPFCVEIKPKGPNIEKPFNFKYVKPAVRVAAEIGADFVKTYYTGDSASFKEVVDCATVPVVILGGPRTENILELLQAVRDAINVGGAGIAFGRNIWSGRDPRPMTHALARIIHDNEEPELLVKELGLL